jgi:hypothetical protein
MKTLSIIIVLFFATLSGFSQNNCATSFKVNNGNGTCGALGQLRLTFSGNCPQEQEEAPQIDSVYTNGIKSNVAFSKPDISKCGGNNGYISYCITSGNVPPANTWKIYFHKEGNSFSCVVSNTTTNVLPVKFVSFDAAAAGNSITCKWSTEAEINNHHFELERSFNGIDFTTAAILFSAENATNVRNTYSYKDNSSTIQNRSMVFYRVKQVDMDGNASYSYIVIVKFAADYAKNIQISPNPFTETLAIKFESAETGNAEIKILTLTGQPVATKNAVINKGSNNLQVGNLSNLSKGVYVAQVSINGAYAGNQKVIKN